MPVSLSEWRVRIGTFVHLIREYEVKERRERLLKERIRRLKVLCKRLEAEMGDSGEESEDDKSRQDDLDPKGCPHTTLNIRSSGNSSDIKDLLTSCDQCIQDLLTASDSHIKEILTPSDTCIKRLLTPRRERLQRIQRLNVLCKTLEAKMGDSGEESEDDKSRQDDPGHKGCPHKTSNIRSSGNSSDIKDLLTSCDQCIHDLLTASDSHIKEKLGTSDTCIKQLLTPTDSNIRHRLSVTHSCRKDQHIACDSHVEDLTMLTPNFSNIRELIIHSDSCFRELHMSADACRDDMLSDSDVKELLTPRDSVIIEILQPKDYCTNRLLTPRDSYIQTSLPRDSCIQETFALTDSYTSESPTTGDSYIHELFTARDSHTNELMTLTDSYANEPLTPGDSYIKELLTPKNSYTNESLTPGDSYTQDLLTPRDSDIPELLTPRYIYTIVSIASGDSYIQELITPSDSYTNEPPRPGYSYTNKSLTGVIGLESPRQGDNKSSPTSRLNRDAVQHGPSGGKEMANASSRSSCHKTDSLKGTVDVMSSQQPYLTELLLVKAGDVELNPGPLHGPIDSVLQESELILLAEEVPVDCYNKLCTGLGFSLTQSQTVLTQHLLNFPGALINLFCRWKVKQRDGTNIRALLGKILKNADMEGLQTKLLKGAYITSATSPSDPILDTSQPNMTEAQVLQCGEDLRTFYSHDMCKIKPDPLDFNIIFEFKQIYTNLTLLRKEMGSRRTEEPLDYTELLTTKINGVLPKRLLVEGEGGVGKTTFCSKIAWDWVNGSPEFQRFSWVLVIPLRNVVKGQTIGDIMKNYLSDNNAVNPKQIDNYILSQPTKVLIVLDGLDEYDGDLSANENSEISQILRSKKFKQCVVIVTTRPWRAHTIKSNKGLSKSYAFIAVKGFSAKNISKYISKYFVKDENAGSELCQFIEVNDVIKENMAPFPIFVAMLWILWENCDSEKRETIRRLKTFSQIFEQMITSLRDHYVSKDAEVLHDAHLDEKMENTKFCLQRIGSIAFSGLLKKKLVFHEEDFSSCKEAMETCCRIGVLSRENQSVSKWKRTLTTSQPITTSVFFPHKLFQEYIASVYLASLYDTNREEYSRSMGKVLSDNPQEFRYLLYFTAALGKEVGLDIVKKIQKNDFPDVQQRRRNNDFLADVTFEAYNDDTARAVGQWIFADEKMLTFGKDMPAHTVSGYIFIMEQHGMETLVFRHRSCGPTVSRDLADVLFASNSLSKLVFDCTTLDDDFYQLMHTRVSTMAGDKFSIKELVVDHQFLNGIQRFNNGDINVTIGDLFPSLTQLTFNTLHTVSPGDVDRLAHSTLAVLSIEHGEEEGVGWRNVLPLSGEKGRKLVPLIGEPTSLGQLVSSSFPQLACLTFRELVMGNIRSEAILRYLKNHLHLKSISIISCFTDDELDPLAKQITTDNRMKITLQHDTAQRTLSLVSSTGPLTIDMIDALCHRTCVRQLDVAKNGLKIASNECFPDLHGREVDSKIHTFKVDTLKLRDDQSASYCLGKFISLLPHLTDVKIESCSFHDDYYKEIADRASSFQIQTFLVDNLNLRDNQSASYCLGKFISLLPHLIDLKIRSCYLHDDYYKEIADRAPLSQIQTFKVDNLILRDDQSASYCLERFISLLPHLTYLEICSCSFHDDFYKEITNRASSSQIHKLTISGLRLLDNQSASCCLGKFLSLLPHLTDLKICKLSLHDDFYKEIADRASSSQIRKFMVIGLELYCNRSASSCLGKFVGLLPHLTDLDLEIRACYVRDEFYEEIADRASSSQIRTLNISRSNLHFYPSASCCLGRFLSLLPHLTDLKISSCSFHDDFYKQIADRASSSQIQTVNLDFTFSECLPGDPEADSHEASNQLAKFICSLSRLTTLKIDGYMMGSLDDFFTELYSLAASSQSPYFREKTNIGWLQEWSERKRHRLELANQFGFPMTSAHEQRMLNFIIPLLETVLDSGQLRSDPHRSIQSEPQQVQELPREGTHRSLHPSSGEASRHSVDQGSGYSSGVHTGLTAFSLSSRTSNFDMPSTSGSRSTQAPVESKRIPEHRKRIQSDEDGNDDDGDRVDESLEQRPRKRRAKTDRQPTSP